MKLMTKEILESIPALYAQDGKGDEAIAYVKYFDPTGSWYWYGTEYDPEEKIFFGLVFGSETELGNFSLVELESIKGRFGLGIERDISFKPIPLKQVKEEMSKRGYKVY